MAALADLVHGNPIEPAGDRVLTTLLFTDIVDSTRSLAAIGDRRWDVELDEHDQLVRRQLTRFSGNELKTTGDGFVARFDSPTRATQCALAIQHDATRRRIGIRAGLHIGEVKLRGNDVVGLTIHIAQRVCSLAGTGQVLVTQRVVDLVDPTELRFTACGEHHLKGLDDAWMIFEAMLR